MKKNLNITNLVGINLSFSNRTQHFYEKMDFTYHKYETFCKVLAESGIPVLTVRDYILLEKKPAKFTIIRHDIDDESDLDYALRMAVTENNFGLQTTYYFRICKNVFNTEAIKQISKLGHEIGYHYEVLGEAKGDYKKAIELFEQHLEEFRKYYDVKTIAQHGGPLRNCLNVVKISNIRSVFAYFLRGEQIFDHWESKDLWKKYDYSMYGIIGEPYISINFAEVMYLSDTNRSWVDNVYRMKDRVNSNFQFVAIKKTDEIINHLRIGDLKKTHFLIHPSNWKITVKEWVIWLFLQYARNMGKRILIVLKQKK